MDLSEFPNLEKKTRTVELKKAEEIRDGVKFPQIITIITTKELFSNKNKSKTIQKVTVDTQTTTHLPDGSVEVKKQTKVSATEVIREKPETYLEGFEPIGEPKVVIGRKTHKVHQGDKIIERTKILNITTQEYQDASGNKKLKQVVKITTEDKQPDGKIVQSVQEATSIVCEHQDSPSE